MVEFENHTLHLLEEIRGHLLPPELPALDGKVLRNHSRNASMSFAKSSEASAFSGRYATAEFDERLSAPKRHVSVLNSGR